MENVDREYEILTKGIRQLLGKEEYLPSERAREACVHVSDGFIYNRDAPNVDVISLLQCARCGVQYEILNETGVIL